ncbi:MAG: glutamate racemase, partial [Selenomonas sp.]|nr:glutamate racemase [Selenomonas sp.]
TAHCTVFASGRPVVRAEELAYMEANLARAARMEEIV